MGDGHTQRRIQRNGWRIVAVYIQHAGAQAALCKVGKASNRECTTEPLAMVRGVDTNHINLAGWVCGVVVVHGVVVNIVVVRAGVRMRFRPTEASHCSVDVEDEKTVCIKPRFSDSLRQYCRCPVPLLGVTGKCSRIERQPLVVVSAWPKWASGEALG